MNPRPRVLLLAYLVSPLRGSEYSVAWNHITWMAEYCDITVLYGSAGANMGDIAELSDYVSEQPMPHVTFVPVPPPLLARWLNSANRRGFLTYSFYLAYRAWHREAGKVARIILRKDSFDLVHYLGPIGYREPGYLCTLDLPYVWGPIGGATHFPVVLLGALPWSGFLKLALRAIVNWFQLRYSLRVRRALRRADILLTATSENQEIFRKILDVDSIHLPENGVIGPISLNESKFDKIQTLKLVWIGSIEARKALKLLVDALNLMRNRARFEVHVIGDGPLRASVQNAAAVAGLTGQFVWHGQIGRDAVRQVLDASHLHVVTSVSEGNPTTVWEAMSCGVPTLTLDHCGMKDTVHEGAGMKVAVGPYAQVVKGFADCLDTVADEPQRLRSMAEQVLLDADRFHWKHRPAFWLKCYSEAMMRYRTRTMNRLTSQDRQM